MIRSLFLVVCFFLGLSQAQAHIYRVYDRDTPNPYILLRPQKGVFLGRMIASLGLKPNWTQRKWVKIIHQANVKQVSPNGDIRFHNQDIKIPLLALEQLDGYVFLKNHLQGLASLPPMAPPPSQSSLNPPPTEESTITENSQDSTSPTSQWLLTTGTGTEQLSADDGAGTMTKLITNLIFFAKVDFSMAINEDQKWHVGLNTQLKTYKAPPSVGYNEDQVVLVDLQYDYSVRVFDQGFLQLLGRSKQFNYVSFIGNSIHLQSAFGHSIGVGLATPWTTIANKQLHFDINANLIYANGADADTDSGVFASTTLQMKPPGFEDGWAAGLTLNYFDQKPSSFSQHSAVEGLVFAGYAF